MQKKNNQNGLNSQTNIKSNKKAQKYSKMNKTKRKLTPLNEWKKKKIGIFRKMCKKMASGNKIHMTGVQGI